MTLLTQLVKDPVPPGVLLETAPIAAPAPGTQLVSTLGWNNLIDLLQGTSVDEIDTNAIEALGLNFAMITDGTGHMAVSPTTAAELAFVSGLTSALQTQLDGKEPTIGFTPENAANKGAISGYAGLDASQLLLLTNFPAGTGSQILRRNAGNTALEFFTLPASTLEALTDTTITAAAANQVLVRNAGNTAWVNELLDNANLATGVFGNITGLGVQTQDLDMGTFKITGAVATDVILNSLSGLSLEFSGTEQYRITNQRIDCLGNDIFNVGEIKMLDPGAAAILNMEKDSSVPADGITIAQINHDDDNSVGIRHTYTQITSLIENPADGVEAGEFRIKVREAGTLTDYLILNSANANNVSLLRPVDFNSQNATNLGTLNTHTIPAGTDTFALLNAAQTLDLKTLTNVGAVTMVNRFQYDKGADVASPAGGILTLGTDGNVFDITGVNTINEILATNWQAGSVIHLQFDGVLTVTHNSAGTNDILLGPQTNMTTAAGDVLTLFFNGVDWVEISRSRGGGQTPILTDVDYDGFDIQDLSNLEFRATTGAPLGSVPAIYYNTGSDLTINTPSGDFIDFTINDVSKVQVIGNGLNIAANESILWGLNGNQRISNDTGGFTFETETGDIFEYQVNSIVEYTFSATQVDFISNNIVNLGTLNTHTLPGGSAQLVDLSTAQALTNKALGAGTTFSADFTLNDGVDIITNATTGSSFGTATTQKISFYGVAPVVQPTALTAADTTITHTAPSVADFAIQALTTTTPFGFVTADEGHTVLQVIANLQTRVNELETKLQALGAIA